MEVMTQCENCDQTFTAAKFAEHECAYSDRETFVFDDQMMNFLWEDSSLRKIYRDNEKVIAQILDQCGEVNGRSKDTKKLAVQAHYVCSGAY